MCRVDPFRIKPLLWLSLIVACWLGSFDCVESSRHVHAQIYKGSKTVVPSPGSSTNRYAANQTKNYFTVIGEVKYPETYELPTSAPSLIGFIKLAGGLQPSASGQLRIVRFSRTGQKAEQQLFYDERRTDTLQPGDVVVVDSKVGNARLFSGPDQSVNEGDVYLALIGILEYPFVMQTAAKNASVNWVTQQLHQKDELAQSAKVCLPGRSGTRVTPDTQLPNNSLIHFDASKVIFTQLPEGLPRPFRPGYDQRQQVMAQLTPPPAVASNGTAGPTPGIVVPNATTAPRRPAVVIEEKSEANNSVALDPERVDPPAGRVRVSDPSLSPNAAGQQPAAAPKRLQPPRDANAVDAPHPESVPSPEFQRPFQSESDSHSIDEPAGRAKLNPSTTELALSPINDGEVAKSGSSLAIQGADSMLNAKPASLSKDNQNSGTATVDDLNKTFEVATGEDEAGMPATTSLDYRTITLVTIGGLGSFAFVWVLLGMMKPQRSQQRIFAQSQPVRPLLDRLVNNELEVRIEEARLDPSVRIHGRPRDIGQQRLDAEHRSVPRPHFMAHKPTLTGYSTTVVRPEAPVRSPEVERLERVTAAERRSFARRSTEPMIAQIGPSSDGLEVASNAAPSAAATTTTDTASHSETQDAAARARPKFRLDAVRQVEANSETTVPVPQASILRRPAAHSVSTIKPSRVIADGSDIVDRALAVMGAAERSER